VPRRRQALAATVALSCAALLGASACQSKHDRPSAQRSAPLDPQQIPAGTAQDIRAVQGATYSRTLEAQLDLVPPSADSYVVIRDLRPLVAQARRVEQVMAGPLARAIPALAKLGGGSGEARLAQLGRSRELLTLLLAGLDGSGIELDKGLILVQGRAGTLVLFAAPDLDRLSLLASFAGAQVELTSSCGALNEQPGWFACSLEGADTLADYRPAKQGAALAERLAARLGGVELEQVNLAISMGPLDAVLRTDPGLWELSTPVPGGGGQELLTPGPAPGLRALVPGTSFMWARVDPLRLIGGEPSGPFDAKLLTGELWFGAVDQPNGFAVQAGVTDPSAVAQAIQTGAALLPANPPMPELFEDLSVSLDRASIDLDGKLVPSIGLTLAGESADAWAQTLGVDTRARIWAYGDYLSLAVGEVQAIPTALGQLKGTGPSSAAIAGLPPTLARSLLAGEVGLVLHMVLDHWQAPPSEDELASLLAGVPPEQRPDPAAISALFQALAPWSSADLWLRHAGQQWIANLSLVPFAAIADGVSSAEAQAASEVLDAVLAGADGQAGYRDLLAQFPGSPRASTYRARAGEAPSHHGAAGMIQAGLLGAIALPALTTYLDRAKTSEAVTETGAILNAALAVRERTGSCEALLGEAGPTPALSDPCSAADGGRCRPSPSPSLGEYPLSLWTEDPIWAALAYRPGTGTGAHRYHYAFEGAAVGDACHLRARAYGDLDGDGVYSTYEREATVAADGSQTVPAMRVEQGEE